MNITASEISVPSRRYTCLGCGCKYRRSNSIEQRSRDPICPACVGDVNAANDAASRALSNPLVAEALRSHGWNKS